jgi:CDP-glucose 4,6-dehydratase
MGTAHVLDAVRAEGHPCAVVVVTSDKCYENREWVWGYREDEPMGGHDVYSMSKGAAELVVSSWRRSFFPPAKLAAHGVALASARAGNVVGGGDWSDARIVPDCVRALARTSPSPCATPRRCARGSTCSNPSAPTSSSAPASPATAPTAPKTSARPGTSAPPHDSTRTVREVVEAIIATWGEGSWDDRRDPNAPHEATLLRLSIEKAADAPRVDAPLGLRRDLRPHRALVPKLLPRRDRPRDARALRRADPRVHGRLSLPHRGALRHDEVGRPLAVSGLLVFEHDPVAPPARSHTAPSLESSTSTAVTPSSWSASGAWAA